jgi:hypothetical protein
MQGEQVLQNIITEIFNPAYKLAVSFAILYFLYGGFRFLVSLNNPDEKNTGKSHLLYGLIGLFIIFSVGAIMKFFSGIFGSDVFVF